MAYQWVEDEHDVHLGESLRGMQESMGYEHIGGNTEIGAAQRALATLRNQLGAGLQRQAQQHFNPHAPIQKPLRSPYKDSTQIGIQCLGTFTLSSWSSTALPRISGQTRVYQSFKPNKGILSELLIITYQASGVTAVRSKAVQDASDLVLTSAFSGSYNCFPNAPTEGNGIAGQTFSPNSLGNGISWPTINGGIDMTVEFAVEQSAPFAIDPPAGMTHDDITSIVVKARLNLLGPSLR